MLLTSALSRFRAAKLQSPSRHEVGLYMGTANISKLQEKHAQHQPLFGCLMLDAGCADIRLHLLIFGSIREISRRKPSFARAGHHWDPLRLLVEKRHLRGGSERTGDLDKWQGMS